MSASTLSDKTLVPFLGSVRIRPRRLLLDTPGVCATVPMLHAAVEAVLHQPDCRKAAERVQAAFATAGGPRVAANRLEQLLAA